MLMKRLLLLSAFILFCATSFGQVSTYTFSYSAGVYTPLAGGTALIPPNSSITGNGWFEQCYNVPLPFVYYFNGAGYSSVYINSNGYVTFAKPTLVTNPRPHLVNNGQAGAIMGYGCASTYSYASGPGSILLGGLMDFANANPITYGTIGVAPNRIFIVQWTNAYRSVSYYPSSGVAIESLTFQVRLKEGSNIAEIVYNTSTTNYTPVANPQAGISGSTTADFNLVSGANWTSVVNSTVANGVNIPFTPSVSIPAGTTFTFTPPPALMPAACSGTPPAPTVLSNVSITNSTVNLSLSGLPLATGLTYQWQKSTTGLANSWSNIVGATDPTYVATPTASTYYQCLVACGAGAPVTSTNIGIGYESAYPTIPSYTYNLFGGYPDGQIGAFSIAGTACGTTFNDITNCVSGYNYTAYGGSGGTEYNYLDFTSTIGRIKLQGSTSLSSTFTATINNHATNPGAYCVWIDLNDNGLFTDAGELVGSIGPVAGVATPFTLTIPANNFGIHRMRIRGAFNAAYGTSFPPTGALSYFGETVDYAVEIVPPTPTPTNNSPVCVTGTLQLNSAAVTGPTIYTWSGPLSYYSTTNSTTQNYVVPSTGASGLYTLNTTVNGAKACNSATTTVTVNAQPVAAPTNDGPICQGGTANLNANASLGTGPYSYSWSGPNLSSTTSATPTCTPTATATYSVTVSNAASGCSSGISYTTTVVVNPTPTAAPTNSGPICIGGTVTLTANPGGGATSFVWSGPNLVSNTLANPTATPTATATYSLTVSSGPSSGCSPVTVYTTSVTVNPKPTAAPTNNGPSCSFGTINLTANPAGGTGPYIYSWTGPFLSSTTVANPTATPSGTSVYSLTISNAASGCSSGINYGTTAVVFPRPTATPANNSPMCVGGTANLTSTAANGFGAYTYAWSGPNLSSTTAANPTATPPSTSTYSLTVTNAAPGCVSLVYTTTVTVNAKPTASPSNDAPICVGGTVNLAANPAGGAGTYNYTWSGANLSSTTVANPTATPTTTSTYSLTITTPGSGCSTGLVYTTSATVVPKPTAAPANDGPICVTGTVDLTANPSGGTGAYIYSWAGPDLSSAVVDNPTATPTSSVVYTLTISNAASGCASGIGYTTPVDVYAQPTAAPTNDGPICNGFTVNLAANATDGYGPYIYSWSGPSLSSTTSATTSATPTSTTLYTVTVSNAASGCNSGIEYTTNVVVNPLPSAISGPNNVCEAGSQITLTDAGGGTWTSSNANASVGLTTGVVTGVLAGTSVITYTLPTGCITTKTITINPLPSAISGTTNVCVGLTTLLTDAGGGTWTSSNANATIGLSTGVVTGVAAGTSTISYTLPVTGCVRTTDVTVNPLPSAITGATAFCQNTITTLSDADAGGTWTSSNALIASINPSTGDATGVAPGSVTITYTLPTSCLITRSLSVNPAPNVSVFTPTANDVCVNSSSIVTVNSTSLTAGTYTVSYDLGGANIATGLTATLIMGSGTGNFATPVLSTAGTTTVTINSITNLLTCNTPLTSGNVATLTVNPLPSPISGTAEVCKGYTTTLTDAGGGTWTSANPAIASIGFSSGIVTGTGVGVATITYTLPTGCKTSTIVTVNPVPYPITGLNQVCEGAALSLNNATPGGSWSSSNMTQAIVGTTGIVTGVTAGSPVISYTLPVTGCYVVKPITVNPIPVIPASITGTAIVCAGSNTTLSDITPGGVWSSNNNTIATVNALGVVTGVAAGTATIAYTENSTFCGSASSSVVVTVNPLPLPGTILGTSHVCVGATTALTDAAPGGVWSSTFTGIATVDIAGVVSGVTAGIDTIKYTVTTACGTGSTSMTLTVNPLADAGTITGASSVCVGETINLTDAIPGGIWLSGSHSTVVAGAVTGASAGVDTIKYGVYNICGVNYATKIVTVNATPTPEPIAGPSAVCIGATITLTNTVPGGSWTSSNSTAGISGLGVVSGLHQGRDTIRYTLTGACASFGAVSKVITVNPLPGAYTVTGGSYCPDAAGSPIGLLGSQDNFQYQLIRAGSPVGGIVTGTGTTLDFGTYSDTGTYIIHAVDPATGCAQNMANSIRVYVDTLILPDVFVYAVSSTDVNVGQVVKFTAIVLNGINAYSYRWYLNRTLIPWDTTETYVTSRLMLYDGDSVTCVIKGFGPCGEVYGEKTLAVNLRTVGVNTVTANASDIKVLPNPSKGEFTIKGTLGTTADEDVNIEITDMLGQVVYKDKITALNGNINTPIHLSGSLANGMYIVSLRSGAENKVFHLVIEQ
jgi:uncharacterized protein YjdB